VTKRADILSAPTLSSWDEARGVAEAAVPLLGLCLGVGSLLRECSDPLAGVLGALVVWTPSLVVFGELVIRAERRARFRSTVLAQERRRITRSFFGERPSR
jgi:hypothetical protein